MFINRKSSNLFKKSAKLALIKAKKAETTVKVEETQTKSVEKEEDKPINTPKKSKKQLTTSNGELVNNNNA